MKIKELFEAAAGKDLELDPVEAEKAIELLNTHCKDALWMLLENHPIYRGQRTYKLAQTIKNAGFLKADPSKSERRSENTSNHYTIILDNNPAYSQFPKRSKSLIGTFSQYRANGYSDSGEAYRLIPFDGVKIGIVNRSDMWDTQIRLFGKKQDIHIFNDDFEQLGQSFTRDKPFAIAEPKSIADFEEFDKLLKARDPEAVANFKREFSSNNPKYLDNFLDTIYASFSPAKTGHTVETSATMPHTLGNTEVWVGGPCFLITEKVWNELLKSIRRKVHI